MLVTLSGIVIDVKPVQTENALLPMLVTLLGIVIDIKPVQPENVPPSMLVTPLGIVTEVKPVQPENARSLMRSPLVIVTVLSWLLLIWFAANAGIVAVSIGQPLNAFSPMLVTLSGIVIEVKPLQPENALSPMLFPLVIVTVLS